MLDITAPIRDGRVTDNTLMSALGRIAYVSGSKLAVMSVGEGCDGSVNVLNFKLQNGLSVEENIISFYNKIFNTRFDINNRLLVKTLVYDYLLRTNICYLEDCRESFSKGNTERFSAVSSKFMSTKNSKILGDIKNTVARVCETMYEKSLDIDEEAIFTGFLQYLKVQNNEEKPIIKCNKRLNVSNCNILTLDMIYNWVLGMQSVAYDNLVEITYTKDNGEERKLTTTFNANILKKYYDEDRALSMINSCFIQNGTEAGRYKMPVRSNIERGWIAVPDVGSSVVEDNGTRAVNVLRVKSMRVVETVDTSFINVALSTVVDTFLSEFNTIVARKDAKAIADIYNKMSSMGFGDTVKFPIQYYPNLGEIAVAIRTLIENNKYSGTNFKKAMHRMMISLPTVFPNYIGEKVKVSTGDIGLDYTDF